MHYGKTQVILCEDDVELGRRAGRDVAERMRVLLSEQDEIRMVFAAAESQMKFLESLAEEPDIEWEHVVCFNMDEFYEPAMPAQCTCGHLTTSLLYDRVAPGRVHLLRHDAADPQQEAERFEAILRAEGQIDILCQGIGISGHLAFNEPGDTDFACDPWVRVIRIPELSKRQLMGDPNFMRAGTIPDTGITMTIPALLSGRYKFTMVPLALKRPILEEMFALHHPTEALPASILLTTYGNLYVDRASCPVESSKHR